ncbi:helix-turn-helix transcriptional regulator [Pseudodesulfovibrio pelocollis]|uniref:helix-turn-helix transcriptional regulator n=1 Tax=Pseudodesulfovibrio pelocollis TaxID=3051432 RepID=UPI00255AC1C2|nr:helix-turn-helix domain-containing protein [Pseudodesulfovibrio sp. SB368]
MEIQAEQIRRAMAEALAPLVEIETLKARDYLSPKEVEVVYPLPASTLEKMRKAGRGPRYIKRGKGVLYRHADIRAYLDARCQMTGN